MDNSFIFYLERLEILAFFSGYPLVYLLVSFTGNLKLIKKITSINLVSLMPFAYALTGVLFIGLQLSNLYPDFTLQHIRLNNTQPFLKFWGLLSILFLIPALFKKPVLSLLHSLVFLIAAVMDTFNQILITNNTAAFKNMMTIYTYSLILNITAFSFILLCIFLFRKVIIKKNI